MLLSLTGCGAEETPSAPELDALVDAAPLGMDGGTVDRDGPFVRDAEAIVDLVATGRTLRDNGLIAIEDLFQSTARLVGHPLSMRLDDGPLASIVEAVRGASGVGASGVGEADGASG